MNAQNYETIEELYNALDKALEAIGCELDPSASLQESYEWFAQTGKDGCAQAAKLIHDAIGASSEII